jgi:hypothetical protein
METRRRRRPLARGYEGELMSDDEADRFKRAWGIDENAAGMLDVGDEANPDHGAIPVEELTDEQLLWILLMRARERAGGAREP